MENLYDAIIFDFGGVIIDLDYNKTIEAFNQLGVTNFEELYSQAEQGELFNKIETGEISGQYFINELKKILPQNISPNEVVHAWNAMILDIPIEKLALLEKLKSQNTRTFLLSNTNEIHIPYARRKLKKISEQSLEYYFEKVYFSHDVKMRKPNVEIFNFVCQQNNLNPEKTLFIDDSIQHIEGAKKSGLKTLHLKSEDNLLDYFS